MSRTVESAQELKEALERATGEDGGNELQTCLESLGFASGARSATNLRLLAHLFPPEILHIIAAEAISTPTPDLALNGLERISSIVPAEDLHEICSHKDSLSQLLAVCGSSPFLSGIICRDPAQFRELFLAGGIKVRRSEAEMLAALRGQVDDETDYQSLFPILRRFKVAEVLRVAARDLNGLASLEEVTAELSALASATLQIACEITRRSLVAEYGIPLMGTPSGEEEAVLTVLGMGKLGGGNSIFPPISISSTFTPRTRGRPAGSPTGRKV